MIYHLFPGNMEKQVHYMIMYFRDNHSLLAIKPGEQTFVIFGTDEKNKSTYGCLALSQSHLVFYPSKSIDFHFLKGITAVDSLIIHSVFFRYIWLNLLLWPKFWKRTAIINWGAGFAGFKSIKGRINAQIMRVILPKLGAISTLTPGEFESINKLYGPCDNYVRAFYSFSPCNVTSKIIDSNNDVLHVLVGHSSSPLNGHIEAFRWLQAHRLHRFTVICPLGYPSHQKAKLHRDKVVEAGRKFLGKKFHPILRMLPKEEYKEILDKIDVFVSNSPVQQGLFNIFYLLLKGKKVFIRSDSPTYSMLQDFGIKVYDTLEIPVQSFEEFYSHPPEIREHNIKQWYKNFSDESINKGWQVLFSRIGAC